MGAPHLEGLHTFWKHRQVPLNVAVLSLEAEWIAPHLGALTLDMLQQA